jgi:hypothetical protein
VFGRSCRRLLVSILTYIRENAFGPDEVRALEVAYLNACAAVGGAVQTAELKATVAAQIIAIALTGERDPTQIYLRFMEAGAAATA